MTVDLVAVGEVMLELTADAPLREMPALATAVSGDTFNVAAVAARLGSRAGFVGFVGDDPVAEAVLEGVRRLGVDDTEVRRVAGSTGIYLVTTGDDGERTFTYHRRGSAGSRLDLAALESPLLTQARAVHTSGITLALSEPARRTGLSALKQGASRGALTSYDVNFRPALTTVEAARCHLEHAAPLTELVTLNLEEARLLGGTATAEDAIAWVASLGARHVLVGQGPRGATLGLDGGSAVLSSSALMVTPVDTTAAGDALVGAFLHARLGGRSPEDCLALACAVAARSVTGRGALSGVPDASEVASLVPAVQGR